MLWLKTGGIMKRKLKICIVLLLLFYIFPLYAQSTGESGAVYIGKNLSESDIYAEVFSEMQYWWDQGATSTDIKEKLTKEDTDLICSALNQYDGRFCKRGLQCCPCTCKF